MQFIKHSVLGNTEMKKKKCDSLSLSCSQSVLTDRREAVSSFLVWGKGSEGKEEMNFH